MTLGSCAMKNFTKQLFAMTLCLIGLSDLYAQPKPINIAITSVIGDTVAIVSQEKQTGRLVDANRKQTVALPEGGLDGEIMVLTEQLVKKQCQTCKTSLLKVKAVATPEEGEKLLPGLLGAAKNAKTDRLVVLIKHRAEARISGALGESRGQGKLTGLGFYSDSTTPMKDINSMAKTVGYLAPFAYFRLIVIDVGTGDVILDKDLTASRAYAVNESEAFGLWNAIPDDKKVPAILDLIKIELEKELTTTHLGISK
jgi:hypothetical protein